MCFSKHVIYATNMQSTSISHWNTLRGQNYNCCPCPTWAWTATPSFHDTSCCKHVQNSSLPCNSPLYLISLKFHFLLTKEGDSLAIPWENRLGWVAKALPSPPKTCAMLSGFIGDQFLSWRWLTIEEFSSLFLLSTPLTLTFLFFSLFLSPPLLLSFLFLSYHPNLLSSSPALSLPLSLFHVFFFIC